MGLTEVKPGVVFGWVDHGVDWILDWAKCGLWYMDWTRVLGGLVCLVLVLISKGSVWFLVIKSQGPKI